MFGFAKATAACGSALRAFSTTFFLGLLTVAALLLIASPSPVEAASPGVPGGTCTIAFGTVPYASSGNLHVQAGGSAEQIDCDPRYPAADSGVAPPNSGTSAGGGTWSALTNVSDNTITYTPHPLWVGADTFTMYFCNDVGCTGAGRVTATVNVTVAAPTLSLTASLSNGTVGIAYNQTLTASGGGGTFTFSLLSGTLPTGLSLTGATSTTVALSGTPTAGGVFNFTIRATDNSIGPDGPVTKDQAYTVTITPPTITISPTTIPNGTRGTAYSQTLTANGGTAPRSWNVSTGSLPTGITLSAAGVLSGTPTAVGPFAFTARAQDSSTGTGPYSGVRFYTFNIAEIPPVAGAATATVAHNSSANPITLSITGGAPSSVAVASGATHGTATASGTSITYTPTSGYAGPDSFTYTATNVAGTSAPATVTITVSPPTLALNPATLPDGTTGVAYSQSTTASGGQASYTYSISVGTLPAGLSIDPGTGLISGTPSATGTSNFTVRAQDSSTGPAAPFVVTRAYSVTVLAPPVAITSPAAGALPGGTGGGAYSQTFIASGGQAPHGFTLASGAFPPGLTLSAGVLSGTPTAAGTFNFSLTTTDTSPNPGPYTSLPVAYSLTITAPTITVSPTTLPAATTAVAYSETITATGGTGSHTLSVSAGSLPGGLALVGSAVSGTPTAAGTFNFTITATDALGFTGSQAYTVIVADPVITITSPSAGALPAATGGTAYSQVFTASGGQGSHSFAVSAGATPSGITLSPAGVLSGTPTVAGTFNFSVTATDASPVVDGGPFTSAPVAYSLTVNAPAITVSPTSLPNATTALAYSETITATGGTTPHTFAITAGTQPTGMTLASGGVLSGTPTAAGTYNFTITATDALSFTGARAYTITVSDPVITIASPAAGALPPATGGTAYSQTFTASGGQGSHSFVETGALPAGITLSPAGILSGTPTVAGTFNFTVTATDASPGPGGPFTSAAVAYSLTVNAPTITMSPGSLPAGTTALAYITTSVVAAGGTAPYSYAVTAGALPVGLNLSTTGEISGTPTANGTFNFTITATDTHSFTGSQAYSITVSDPVVAITSPAPGALPDAEPGVAYSPQSFSASGGQGSHSFVVASGALPSGVSLSTSGVLSGTPTVTGSFNFSVTATDSSPTPGGPFTSLPVAYSLTVSDTLPPALVGMPANIVIEVDYPVTSAVATWTAPTATDNQAGTTVTQTAGLASGATFPLGTTTITYEARDIANLTTSANFTVTVTQPLPGQVTMLISSTTDGAFGFTSSEPALNVTVNTASGNGTSGALTVPVGSHSITLTVPAGVEIVSASCTDPASSIDPATLSGTISVTAGAVISCTISSADPRQTTELIGSFLQARSELILANEPDSNRRIERLTGAYTGQGGVSGFGLGFTDERMPFALSFSENEASFGYSLRRSQAQGTADARIASAHNLPIGPRRGMTGGMTETMPVTAFGENTQPQAKPWPLESKQGIAPDTGAATDPMATPFDIWIEGKLARFDANGGDGRFGIMHAGVDYLVTPRILIGLGAQLDWTDMDGADDSTISGTGYLVGPYVTARLTDNLFLDGRAAWGQSANDVSPFGTYTDKLDATRWLVSLALIGQYDIDRWRFTPKAKLAYFEEETEPYLDGLGLDIPSISIATGTLEFGPTLSYRMELANGMSFEPFATLEGIWTFKQENTATSATSAPGLGETGLRGRGEIGFSLAGQSASSQSSSSLSSSIFYDGVGNEDFQAWGGKLRFDHRF